MKRDKYKKDPDWDKNKSYLLECLAQVVDVSCLDLTKDIWEIDSVNHMGVDFTGTGTIVYLPYADHRHFDTWGIEGESVEDVLQETATFIGELLGGETRFVQTFRKDNLMRTEYYTRAEATDEWVAQECYSTSCISCCLFPPFYKPTHKTETIVVFKQQ
ncbi:MAG: hypothetical protein LBS74_07480 [Oscillospiraceae bacterium]|jgi:hypothetical protein|nr:hypothetical protein [Oscillospiraceae bacterium]